MRIKDINEKDDKRVRSAFGRGMGKGWQATQKGGWLAPDSLERGIKKFFTDPGADPDSKTKDKDTKKVKGGAGTADTVKKSKEKDPKKTVDIDKNVSNAPLDIKKPIPDTAQFMDGKIKFKYDAKKGEWISNSGRTLSAQDGVKAYNKTHKKYRQYVVKNETKEENMSKAIKEGLADLAGRAEADHEVQMARADLYKIAKYAIKLHDMLKGVSEEQGLEGWQQAKITKAADYIGSVYHNLDYDMKFGEGMNEGVEMCPEECCGKPVTECSCGPDCPHCDCYEKNKAMKEGKSPHKKGSAKYKKHMAAMHAESDNPEDGYKKRIGKKLRQKLRASLQPQKIDPQQIAPKEYEPNTGGHPTGS
jgi:hypothetical protein